MAAAPVVSIVMPVYGCEDYLEEAIGSIVSQTFNDFELIVICDDPSDGTRAILDRFCEGDARIKVHYQGRQGLINSLNKGCRLAAGRFIARMDADDVSMPDRLEKQVRFMEAHPDIGVLSTWFRFMGTDGKPGRIMRLPDSPDIIGWQILFENPIAHPSVMVRKEVMEQLGYYDSSALYAEDYDLWARATGITRLANLPEALLWYRVREDSICGQRLDEHELTVKRTMRQLAGRLLGHDVPDAQIDVLRQMSFGRPVDDANLVCATAELIDAMYHSYMQKHRMRYSYGRSIARSTGLKLFVLSSWAGRHSVEKRRKIFRMACRIDPLVRPRAIYYSCREMASSVPKYVISTVNRFKA